VRVFRAPRPEGAEVGRARSADATTFGARGDASRTNVKDIIVTRTRFQQLVDEALASIPEEFRNALQNIAIVVESAPTAAHLADVGIEPPETLLGLYEGTPLIARGWAQGNILPDKITLFQDPIEEASTDEEDIVVAIGETLIHEVGHYFGLSEEEIEEIEDHYWHADAPDDEGTA
jgi:predicted Zn-dependent protease with MMP-like domain